MRAQIDNLNTQPKVDLEAIKAKIAEEKQK